MAKPERRELILETVIKLLSARGLEGVTHRAVDESAGLPQGSSSYYYPKKAGMLVAASEHLAALLERTAMTCRSALRMWQRRTAWMQPSNM